MNYFIILLKVSEKAIQNTNRRNEGNIKLPLEQIIATGQTHHGADIRGLGLRDNKTLA